MGRSWENCPPTHTHFTEGEPRPEMGNGLQREVPRAALNGASQAKPLVWARAPEGR